MTMQMALGTVALEVRANKRVIQLEEIIFTEEVKKESIILAAYYYVKQLFEQNLITEKELNHIKQKYHIDIE